MHNQRSPSPSLYFYLYFCYLFALTFSSLLDWKLVVKLKGLLSISGP
jgi:hypothetical protein